MHMNAAATEQDRARFWIRVAAWLAAGPYVWVCWGLLNSSGSNFWLAVAFALCFVVPQFASRALYRNQRYRTAIAVAWVSAVLLAASLGYAIYMISRLPKHLL